MQSKTLTQLGSIALILSGVFYIGDTLIDWLKPGNVFGVGIGVSLFGLFGMTALYFTALRDQGLIGFLAYVLSAMGLTGLAGIALFNNLMQPLLAPEVLGTLFSGPALIYFISTGVTLLIGGLFLAAAVWTSPKLPKVTALIYLAGCIPVALPPLFPPILTELGGLAISSALIIWGIVIFQAALSDSQSERSLQTA